MRALSSQERLPLVQLLHAGWSKMSTTYQEEDSRRWHELYSRSSLSENAMGVR